jgi:two-component sensor histidine kinase
MSEDATQVRKLLRQQAAIAHFGSFALRKSDVLKVLTEAARVCAECLSVPYSKVCRYREKENDLLIEAGHDWHAGVIGNVVSRADVTSPQGRAFITEKPSICNDLRDDNDFKLPSFYAEHGIVSTIDVIIKGSDDQPYGVLEIDNNEQHDYDQHDIDFLTGFANVLAEAVATSARTSMLQGTIEWMKLLVEEKDRLLEQKKVLAEELQHRVRNNLQLVYGMLSKQLDDTPDAAGQTRHQGHLTPGFDPGTGIRPSARKRDDANHRFWKLCKIAVRESRGNSGGCGRQRNACVRQRRHRARP